MEVGCPIQGVLGQNATSPQTPEPSRLLARLSHLPFPSHRRHSHLFRRYTSTRRIQACRLPFTRHFFPIFCFPEPSFPNLTSSAFDSFSATFTRHDTVSSQQWFSSFLIYSGAFLCLACLRTRGLLAQSPFIPG